MKPKINILLFIVICFASPLSAQQLSLQWAQKMGSTGWDYVNCMITDSSGNYILGGSMKGIFSGDTVHPGLAFSSNAYLASTDTNGKLLWQRVFGGPSFDNITSLAQTPEGVIVSGIFQDTLRYDSLLVSTPSYSGAYVALINNVGQAKRIHQIGGLATIKHISVCSDKNGNTFAAGVFADSLQLAGEELSKMGEKGFFIETLLPGGIEKKPVTFKGTGNCTLGGITTGDSLIFITGSFSDTLHISDTTLISFGEEDVFLASFSYSGELRHLNTVCGIGSELVRSVVFMPDSTVGITGSFDYSVLAEKEILQTKGGKDIFIALFDTTLKQRWIKSIGGPGNDFGYSLCASDENELFVSGNFIRNILMPDENGNIVELEAQSPFGNAFIAKFDKDGDMKATYNLPASSEDYCQSMIACAGGMITAAGNFYESMSFLGTGNDTIELKSAGERDIFVCRFKDLCKGISTEAGPDTLLCPGSSIYLLPVAGFPFFQWQPGGKANRGLDISAIGTYTLLTTDKNGCISRDSLHVMPHPLPTVTAGNDTTVAPGENITLLNAITSNASQITWSSSGTGYFADELQLNTWYSPSFEDIGKGRIILTLTGSNPCATVSDQLEITIKQDDDGITVFPNPTQGNVVLVCKEGLTIKNVSITNQSGNFILPMRTVNNSVFQFNLAAYPPGTFIFHITTPEKQISKVVEKH